MSSNSVTSAHCRDFNFRFPVVVGDQRGKRDRIPIASHPLAMHLITDAGTHVFFTSGKFSGLCCLCAVCSTLIRPVRQPAVRSLWCIVWGGGRPTMPLKKRNKRITQSGLHAALTRFTVELPSNEVPRLNACNHLGGS